MENNAIKIIESPITRADLAILAHEGFGDVIKAVVDIRQGIMAVGGELHADEEVLLSEEYESLRADTWGINLYPAELGGGFIEFDSMVNIKPAHGHRSRGVEDLTIQNKIREIVKKLITD
jgi:hypothetical protein